MRYLLTGGGTGGHVYPLIAIAAEIRKRDSSSEFLYVGVKGKAEEKILMHFPEYPFRKVLSKGMPRNKNPFSFISFIFELSIGMLQSIIILLKFRPDIIIGSGGFASAPIYLAGAILRKKIFVHEQNIFPGIVNRFLGRTATKIGVSFRESLEYFSKNKGVYVGYPVRKSINKYDRSEARKELNIPGNAKVLFVFGGSQGARSINIAVSEIIEKLLKIDNIIIIHGTGRYKTKEYNAYDDTLSLIRKKSVTPDPNGQYRLMSYIDDIEKIYAASDLVVGRAGAGTIMELAASAKPSILIPKLGLPGNHQEFNAQAASSVGGAEFLLESKIKTGEKRIDMVNKDDLLLTVDKLINSPDKLKKMQKKMMMVYQPEAIDRILEVIAEILSAEELIKNKSSDDLKTPFNDISSTVFNPNDFPVLLSPFKVLANAGKGKRWGRGTELQLVRRYLSSRNWKVKNIGVKLTGILEVDEYFDNIILILKDKTPASRFQKLLGGDYKQVGFIRRNAFDTLARLKKWSPDMLDIFHNVTGDPYWEVKVEACRAMGDLSDFVPEKSKKEIIDILFAIQENAYFEVLEASLVALSKYNISLDILPGLRKLYFHPNRKVRISTARLLFKMREEAVFPDENSFYNEISDIFIPGHTENI